MTKLVFISFLFILIASFSQGQQTGNNISDKLLFKYSYISLMPEGEPDDINEFSPLTPEIVAWGADPIHVGLDVLKMKEKLSGYKNIGVKFLASNVWMLTATERFLFQNDKYQNAVCLDIEGNRIIPGWLDSEYNGIKPWWGCTNHPLYRSLIKERVIVGIKGGANMLHLDDHMGTSAAATHAGGCFCDYCMEGFRLWLKENNNAGDLKKKGITDIQYFDYSEVVKNAGFTSLDKYRDGTSQNIIPLRDEFLSYQLYSAAEFVKDLGNVADSVSGQIVPIGINSWNLAPTQLATAHYADYFSNEVSHFDEEDLIPPFVYMLSTSLNKPVFSTGTGEDWIHIKQNNAPTRIKRWIASAYAHGQYFMYSYNKWGYSDETGTMWYQIPIEIYKPICEFITNNSELFDGFEPVKQVGVLYENEVCRNNNWGIRDICKEMNYANIPIGIVASGDSWFNHKLSEEDLSKFEFLILPEVTNISDQEDILLKKFNQHGKLIKWTDKDEVLAKIPSLITINNTDSIWTLPREKHLDETKSEVVVHLINQNYDKVNDVMKVKTDIEIFFNQKLFKGKQVSNVSIIAPDYKKEKLNIKKTDTGFIVNVPSIDIWAVLKIEY